MSIAWIIVLVLGIVGVVFGIIKNEFRTSTFWFLTAFWASLVLAPLGVHMVN